MGIIGRFVCNDLLWKLNLIIEKLNKNSNLKWE